MAALKPSLAHARSRRFVIDPDYRTAVAPPVSAAPWLYLWGDLEAWLLARLRHDGFHDCRHVFHPGLFRGWSPYAIFSHRFTLTRAPKRALVEVVAHGRLVLTVNGRTLLRLDASKTPRPVSVDLGPVLVRGENRVKALITCLDGPPAFRSSGAIATAADWSASRDDMHPSTLTAVPGTAVHWPHEPLRRVVAVRGRRRADGLVDFGVEVIGALTVAARGTGSIAITPGESPAEALAVPAKDRPDGLDQPITRARVRGATVIRTPVVACRYARIDASPGVRATTVRALAECDDLTYAGAFACSDERLTDIWMRSAYTLRLSVRDGLLMDGAKRDRMPWVGDAFLAALCGAYVFAEMSPVRRTLIALAPQDPHTCHANGIIDYSLYWLLALAAYHRHVGDPATVRALWPDAVAVIAALAVQEDRRGFLHKRDGDWLLIDWAEVDKRGVVPALQWLYAWALGEAAGLAGELGERQQERDLRRRRARLVGAIDGTLWDARRGVYATRGSSASRHAQLLAVLAGAPAARRSALGRALAGAALPPVGTPWMRTLEGAALARLGRAEAALAGVRSAWGGMIAAGATTFWEAYDPTQTGDAHYAFYGRPYGKSLCHAWAAGPVWLLPTTIFGVRPLEPGWRTVAVTPARTDLTWAYATVPTPHGALHVELERGRLRVRAPKGIRIVRGG